MKTLVLLSHPNYANSRVNKALFSTASSIGGDISVRHIEAVYGLDTSKIDAKTEQALIEGVDRVVLQFLLYWFYSPAMLKAYIDAVFTRGWAYGSTGTALIGKELQLVVTAGAGEAEYSPQGSVKSSIEQILLGFHSTATYCGMVFNKIKFIGGALNMSDEELTLACDEYKTLLTDSE
ncbi:NAD(P)H-dependent oxidoreductase [Campylobacter sp. 19-13652]|uniref:NAD(P)H-dependent oxidoreductase n=1 Tax=Campylobacter sp. 19-13652 TaxID=2840180 RepID=UPI001C77E377|nr:NAD(P)H-dependent oxidoreductase [Campylobacter sp. 19-13652]BCX78870.1 general stress protein [Campylobacter sp. 19-13652]